MRKEIKQYGNSAVIVLDVEDLKGYDLKVGDFIDISDIVKVKFKPLPKSKNMPKEIKTEVKK